jgi:hypothetical protein
MAGVMGPSAVSTRICELSVWAYAGKLKIRLELIRLSQMRIKIRLYIIFTRLLYLTLFDKSSDYISQWVGEIFGAKA